jgi:hypothetical protein
MSKKNIDLQDRSRGDIEYIFFRGYGQESVFSVGGYEEGSRISTEIKKRGFSAEYSFGVVSVFELSVESNSIQRKRLETMFGRRPAERSYIPVAFVSIESCEMDNVVWSTYVLKKYIDDKYVMEIFNAAKTAIDAVDAEAKMSGIVKKIRHLFRQIE